MARNFKDTVLVDEKNKFRITQHESFVGECLQSNPVHVSPQELAICFNLKGRAEFIMKGKTLTVSGGSLAVYESGATHEFKRRGYDHEFITMCVNKSYLADQLTSSRFLLQPDFRNAIFSEDCQQSLQFTRPLGKRDYEWIGNIEDIHHIPESSKILWVSCKITEFVAWNFFRSTSSDQELFCQKIKRQDSQQIVRAKLILEKTYQDPFSLDDVAKEVGCSSSHLSRTFSKVVGMTMKSYLRGIRVKAAKEKILSGVCNVTEAAFDSGYNSLSHFSKAFKEEFGYKPSELRAQQSKRYS